jgi:predicted transcriptional regulator
MKLGDLAGKLSLKVLSYNEGLQREVSGGYSSDMLSDVLANSLEGNIWITLQTHTNIVAVADLKNLAGIIIVNDRQPDDETLKKAATEKIAIMTTNMSAFESAGMIYKLLSEKD